jgi:DNA-binding PadR family transcriptional regulator
VLACRVVDISNLDIFVLIALADAPAHGYAAMQDIRERSAGRVRVSTGSFYRRLSILIDAGLVEEAQGPKEDDPRRGAYYRVTPPGRQALARERDRLAAVVAAVDALRPASRRSRP